MGSPRMVLDEPLDSPRAELSGRILYVTSDFALPCLQSTTTSQSIWNAGELQDWTITVPGVRFTELLGSCARSPIRIVHRNPAIIDEALGDGAQLAQKVLDLIRAEARWGNWPVDHVEVIGVKDGELENWTYALLLLVFNSDFERADAHLHQLYIKLDHLSESLDSHSRETLRRRLFLDVAINV